MQKQVISIAPGSSLNTFEVLISDGFLRDVFTVRIEIVTIGEDKVQMATSEDKFTSFPTIFTKNIYGITFKFVSDRAYGCSGVRNL